MTKSFNLTSMVMISIFVLTYQKCYANDLADNGIPKKQYIILSTKTNKSGYSIHTKDLVSGKDVKTSKSLIFLLSTSIDSMVVTGEWKHNNTNMLIIISNPLEKQVTDFSANFVRDNEVSIKDKNGKWRRWSLDDLRDEIVKLRQQDK